MRTSSGALILLIILTIMAWCLVIFQETKKRVVNKVPPVKEEKIERHLLASKEEEKINTLKKEADNISQSPWVVEVCASFRYNEAKNLASTLKDRGFPAYISWINLKEQKWYRVSWVYSTEEEAQKMKEKITKEFGITNS